MPMLPVPMSILLQKRQPKLLNFEKEKRDIARRSTTAIVTGLTPRQGVKDSTLFTEFCENNLTVKPRTVETRRMSTDKGPASKLRVKLESKSSVDPILLFSKLIRASSDPDLRKAFFNRDLTRMQAEQAFLRRVERRSAIFMKGNYSMINDYLSQVDWNAFFRFCPNVTTLTAFFTLCQNDAFAKTLLPS